jgi:DNA-directed RNA polymerase sigma subunit (sigma70/sigma32)
MSRKTIAEKMNKTDERIRQIIEGAIVKVRKNDQAMTLLMKYI